MRTVNAKVFCHHYGHRLVIHSHEYVLAAIPVMIDGFRFVFPITAAVVGLLVITALQVIHEDMK